MGLFDRFKKKKEEEKMAEDKKRAEEEERINKRNQELDDFDFKITPEMYNFMPPKAKQQTAVNVNVMQTDSKSAEKSSLYDSKPPRIDEKKQAASIPTLEDLEKEAIAEEEKAYADVNASISYMEGAMRQLDNAPGAVHLRNTLSNIAKDFDDERFNEKFPEYKQVKDVVNRYKLYKLGIFKEDDVRDAISIIKQGKSHNDTFELEDILMPYLTEKKGMNVYFTEDEQDIFRRRFDCDKNAQQRLIASLVLNKQLFYNNLAMSQIFDKFEHTMKNCETIEFMLSVSAPAEKEEDSMRRTR